MDRILSQPQREAALQSQLDELLGHLNYDRELEFQTGDGPADIYLPTRRFVIETKSFGKADPDKPASGGGTQFDQCHRYIRADYRRERQQLGFESDGKQVDVPWKAALTDGRNWWLWEWQVRSDGSLATSADPPESRSFAPEEGSHAVDWITANADKTSGKRWIPGDPTKLFRPFERRLKAIHQQLTSDQGTKTKQQLWLDMLRGSGSAPSSNLEDDLFVLHTLLVTVARAVIATLSEAAANPTDAMAEGFASWPQARSASGPTHTPGVEWTEQLFEEVDRYDWRQRGRDVLRVLYQELIPKSQRKAFGEYYTPDWLAEAVVEEILDDTWLERSVPIILKDSTAAGVGVLDPACGSGTFLFHAARRILGSPAVARQRLAPVQRADLAANLINGIDIHPVAVEISRATLLRALPANPSSGTSALRVFQGDSLLWNSMVAVGDEHAPNVQGKFAIENNQFVVNSAKNSQIRIPLTFAIKPTFTSDVTRMVEAAHRGDPMPVIWSQLGPADQETLDSTFSTLTDVIAAEGNSVWAWYITNAAAPLAIREREVDRIVANPPWVRMSNITVRARKRELESLAERLNLWGLGKANTGFDIASLFVVRCRSNYLTSSASSAAGWVLPWGSLNASNWKSARHAQYPLTAEVWDLSKMREQPFTGSKSCVWIQNVAKHNAHSPSMRRLINQSSGKVSRNDSWSTARTATHFVNIPAPPTPARSEYFTRTKSGKNKPIFAQGATLVPHCLVKVHKKDELPDGNFFVTTTYSQKEPWKNQGQQEGNVPSRWIHKTVFSKDLLVFTLREPLSETVLPLTEDHELDPERKKERYWDVVKTVYARNKGKGKGTPTTLWKQFNFQNKLLKQFQNANLSSFKKLKVLYNSSGQNLRATRCFIRAIAESSLYHATFKSEEEACYITSMLNAACLQEAYAQSRKSDRHFHQYFWHEIPIPRYDDHNPDHKELARLCLHAEDVALTTMIKSKYNGGQIKCSNAIREALTQSGVSHAIDEAVRRILPGYATPT